MYRCWYFKSRERFSPLFSYGTQHKECTEQDICSAHGISKVGLGSDAVQARAQDRNAGSV